MVKLSLALPDEIRGIMDKHKEINWEEIASDYLWEYAKKIELVDRIASESKLTEEEADKISRPIKQKIALKYR